MSDVEAVLIQSEDSAPKNVMAIEMQNSANSCSNRKSSQNHRSNTKDSKNKNKNCQMMQDSILDEDLLND